MKRDAMAQFTEFAYEWQDQISQSGLKEALAWRDDPYKELDTYKK